MKTTTATGRRTGGTEAVSSCAETTTPPQKTDAKDGSEPEEFGGSLGAALIMLFSHLIPYYLWFSVRFHSGRVFVPSRADLDLLRQFAAPTWTGFGLYLGYLLFQLLLGVTLPGARIQGLPVPSEGGRRLTYNCNGVAAWYLTLATLAVGHLRGWLPLGLIVDHFGEILTAAVVSSDAISLAAYASAQATGRSLRMSGHPIYDFFMGAWLNPHIGCFDFKLWGETRIAWTTLFILAAAAAAKHVEASGSISPSMCFILTAQWLYSNAVMKGEECIVSTWDIFYEKWGWMLIYWNFAGVPFVYCIQALYMFYEGPVQLPMPMIVAMFVVLFATYYIWDTSQSQRNRFRLQLAGTYVPRWAFPQLPWGTLTNPKYLKTESGSLLLIDGWWKYARKIHYTCDVVFALLWGLCCGFRSPIPYFYFVFFAGMITHRYHRDVTRCRRKYGADWTRYEKAVPYAFVPGVF